MFDERLLKTPQDRDQWINEIKSRVYDFDPDTTSGGCPLPCVVLWEILYSHEADLITYEFFDQNAINRLQSKLNEDV